MPSWASSVAAFSVMTLPASVVGVRLREAGLLVERALAEGEHHGAGLGDAGRQRGDGRLELVGRHGLVDEAPVHGGGGVDEVAREEHLHGALRARWSGVSGTIGVEQNRPMRTPGVANRASVVATARSQLATSWQPGRGGDAVHLGDDRLRDRLHRRHERAAGGEELGRLVALAGRELREVVPGREGGAGPGDHDDPARAPARGRPAAPA